jgi:hypothetical protein
MVLGMSLATYTFIHVLISLIGIVSGWIVMYGLVSARRMEGMTAIFIVSTVLTSVTGFFFPFTHVTPGLILGAISLVTLAIAIAARYTFHLAGPWRLIYVVTATMALYFNMFVLVVQSFEKVPALNALAPTQKEPPFLIAQLAVLLVFVLLGVAATRRFRLVAISTT